MITPQEGHNPKKDKPENVKKIKLKNPSEILIEYTKARNAFIRQYKLPWQIWEVA